MRKKSLFGCAAVLFAFAALVGCNEPEEKVQYVKTDLVQWVFQPIGAEPVKILVQSNPAEWKVEVPSDSWVTVKEQQKDAFVLQAEDNTLDVERSVEVVIKAGEASTTLKVSQLAEVALQSGYDTVEEYVGGAAVSPNGIYGGGFYSVFDDVDKVWIKHVVITNLRTGEEYLLDPFPGTLYSLYDPCAITDSGDIFFHCEDGRIIMFSTDGEVQEVAQVDGKYTPWLWQVGDDASRVWVGLCLNAGTLYSPVKWTDGIAEILPKPETTYRGGQWKQGCMARGCSLDGEIVYGTAWEGHDAGLIWWDRNDEPHWVSRELREVEMFDVSTQTKYKYNLVNGVTGTSEPYCISPSGKWIAGTYYEEDLNEAKTEILLNSYPAFYDTENDQLYTFKEYSGSAGITATDDGIGVIGLDASSGITSSTEMIDIPTGTRISTTTEWIYEKMGIIIPSNSIVEFISPDQKVAFGYDLNGSEVDPMRKWYVFPKVK